MSIQWPSLGVETPPCQCTLSKAEKRAGKSLGLLNADIYRQYLFSNFTTEKRWVSLRCLPLKDIKTLQITERIAEISIFKDMKAIRTLIFILFTSHVFAQPGPDVVFPTNINLNQYPSFFSRVFDKDSLAINFQKSQLGVITIDSTSDLSIIPLLKKEKHLALKISIPNIPNKFKTFRNTQSLYLTIKAHSTDLSFLNKFPNLQKFHLETSGDLRLSKYLFLDSLKVLEVDYSKELTSLKVFKKIKSLKKIQIRHVPNLKEFPEFDTINRIKYVTIYQESGNGCSNCPPNPNNLDISNLNKLNHLEELELYNVNGLTEIPDDLSNQLRVFKTHNIFRMNKDYAVRSHIQDVSNFANYDKLEVIEISGVHLKGFNGDFKKLRLKKLNLTSIVGLEDISGIFTMGRIDNVKIEHSNIQTIKGRECNTHIGKMIFSDCTKIENIDFLLSCEHINFLQLDGGRKLLLPNPEEWKIPNLSIYAQDEAGRFYVSKKGGEIVDSLNLKLYIK
jgi:hypothetical protein